MADIYSYEIGTTSSTVNLESLTVPVNPPIGDFKEWSRSYDRSDGMVAGDGFPSAIWRFDTLTIAQVAQLRTFCTGRSASIYINTRKPDDAFGKYSCVMAWDEDQVRKRTFKGFVIGLEIEFRKLEAV
jgi:hypothetical protein